jgi:hypothetical protein
MSLLNDGNVQNYAQNFGRCGTKHKSVAAYRNNNKLCHKNLGTFLLTSFKVTFIIRSQRSQSVMKDPGSNLGTCLFHY